MLTVSSIGHAAIRIKELERTLDFYVGKLGFQEMMRIDRDGQLWIVYLRITDDQYLELFPGGDGESAPPREAIGYNHICLIVPDIHACARELEAAGVPLTSPVVKHTADNNWQCWIADPDGHRIELMQMVQDSVQAAAIARIRSAR